MKSDPWPAISKELRRGQLLIAVLSGLNRARHAFELHQLLAKHGLLVQEGTLYPLLRRLKGLGYLQSEWHICDDTPLRFYQITSEGQQALEKMKALANDIGISIIRISREDENENDG